MTKDLLIIADTHFLSMDAELTGFVRFLNEVGSEAGTVVHLGDIFNIWLGYPRFELEHMNPVLDAFRTLRSHGVRTILVEGNRDFYTRRSYEGDAFDDVIEEDIDFPLVEGDLPVTPGTVRMAHGDLINVNDTPYRMWRRFARSRAVRGLVGLLPVSVGLGLADRLEKKLRDSNMHHKSRFPEKPAQDYARRAFANGAQLVFLGHFHEEQIIDLRTFDGTDGSRGGILVTLPDWRSSHRFVRVTPDGTWRFEDWRQS